MRLIATQMSPIVRTNGKNSIKTSENELFSFYRAFYFKRNGNYCQSSAEKRNDFFIKIEMTLKINYTAVKLSEAKRDSRVHLHIFCATHVPILEQSAFCSLYPQCVCASHNAFRLSASMVVRFGKKSCFA